MPKSIDQGGGVSLWPGLIIDLGLIALFGIQHSGMARPTFKHWWNQRLPEAIQRSSYVLLTSLFLIMMMVAWQPLPLLIWDVQLNGLRALMWGLFGIGWGLVFAASQMISSRHLFGLQQVEEYSQGRPLSTPDFQTPALYRYLRHPMMLGFLIAFWAAPTMTLGHLIFTLGSSFYILIGLQFEEKDLKDHLGQEYQKYRQQVSMLIPVPGRKTDRERFWLK